MNQKLQVILGLSLVFLLAACQPAGPVDSATTGDFSSTATPYEPWNQTSTLNPVENSSTNEPYGSSTPTTNASTGTDVDFNGTAYTGVTSSETASGNTGIDQYLGELYSTVYRREPDDAGLQYWRNAYNSGGAGCAAIAIAFVRSSENAYRNAVGTSSAANGTYIHVMYHALLIRAPDSAGYQYWKTALDQGYPVAQLEESMVASSEFASRCSRLGLR